MNEYYGIYPAFVADINDPEKRGRVRCISPEAFGDDEAQTGWCEPCIVLGGDFYLPPVGEGVYIMFEEGDIDQPVYLGSWYAEGELPESFDSIVGKRYVSFEDTFIIMEEGKINIKVADGDTEIVIENGSLTINGNITINGNVSVKGIVSSTGDNTIGGKSYLSHTHTGVHGETGTPN